MEMKQYTPEDFHILEKWFSEWGWTLCDRRSIAKNAYFVIQDGAPVVFSFFCESDTNGSFLGFTISDKNCSKEIVRECLDKLLVFLFAEAKSLGYDYMLYSTDNKAMVNRLVDLKLMQVTDNASGYILVGELGTPKTLSSIF
jgi:hypothetical protein